MRARRGAYGGHTVCRTNPAALPSSGRRPLSYLGNRLRCLTLAGLMSPLWIAAESLFTSGHFQCAGSLLYGLVFLNRKTVDKVSGICTYALILLTEGVF